MSLRVHLPAGVGALVVAALVSVVSCSETKQPSGNARTESQALAPVLPAYRDVPVIVEQKPWLFEQES